MRRLWIAGALASSLALAACGVSASIDQAVSSIGASPYLQVRLSADVTGNGSAQVHRVLSALSLDMHFSSVNGGALSQSGGQVNSELIVNNNGAALLDLRQIDKNLYVRIDLSALSGIAGIGVSAQQLSNYQLLFGDRWFQFSSHLLNSVLPTTTINATKTYEEQTVLRGMFAALAALIDKTPYTTLPGGGYSQSGTLSAVAKAVLPVLNRFTQRSLKPSSVLGTYTIGFTMSGTTATGGSLSITAPNGSSGDATLGLRATLTHDNVAVSVPSGATVISNSMLSQLLTQFKGTNLPLG